MSVFFTAVIDEGLRFLVDQNLGPPVDGIDLNDLIGLMPPLVVFKGKGPTVLPPLKIAQTVLVVEFPCGDLDMPWTIQEKQLWTSKGEFIPGFEIIPGL